MQVHGSSDAGMMRIATPTVRDPPLPRKGILHTRSGRNLSDIAHVESGGSPPMAPAPGLRHGTVT